MNGIRYVQLAPVYQQEKGGDELEKLRDFKAHLDVG